jgi:hypothetical protein
MGKQPRHHHYVPQFYLAGFTATGQGDGPLHILDCEEGRIWKSTPKGTAHERDFHAIDLGVDNDRMVVEKKLAECEGKWASVLKEIRQNKALPQGDALGDLLAFVSFMAVRVPRIRTQVSEFIDRASKAQLRATFATNEGRDHFRSVIEEYITTLPLTEQRHIRQIIDDDPNLDKFAEHVQSEKYTVSYGQTWDVQTMLQMAITLLPVLGQREWAVSLLADDAPDLICSDSPVCLTWKQPVSGPYPPGFGLRNTLLTVPLGKRMVLVSTFEPLQEASVLAASEVATLNTRTSLYAKQLYLPSNDFVWSAVSGKQGNANDFLESKTAR